MKTKLLSLLAITALPVVAQTPVPSYYGTDQVLFTAVSSPSPINQTATGANLTWNFTNLSAIGESTDYQLTPSASEVSTYPGTTAVVQTLTQVGSVSNELRTYSKAPGNLLSFTGISNGGLILNYSTNNAQIGTFPLSYGYNFVDTVSGTYDNGTYSGTFSGTITTSVDAYGTLNVDGTGGINPYSGPATRLKTVQTLNLNYSVFTNVGTITATTYSYYGTGVNPGIPRFRTSTTTVAVPLLSINDTVSAMEVYAANLLHRDQFETAVSVLLYPNPAESELQIAVAGHKVQSVRITDLSGKTVAVSKGETVDVSALLSGIYFATVATEVGVSTQKFVKK